MRAQDEGFTIQKLFPAEAVGGVKLLKSLASPFSDLRFCPTGGIDIRKRRNTWRCPMCWPWAAAG